MFCGCDYRCQSEKPLSVFFRARQWRLECTTLKIWSIRFVSDCEYEKYLDLAFDFTSELKLNVLLPQSKFLSFENF